MSNFDQPADVTGIDMAFGGDMKKLLPAYQDVSKEYGYNSGKWSCRLVCDWFFSGLKSTEGLVPREGINKTKALAHIKSILASFEPKHEHKQAACAYLLDKWFDGEKSTWEAK